MTELDLEDNCIGPEGAVYIAEALKENMSITYLVCRRFVYSVPPSGQLCNGANMQKYWLETTEKAHVRSPKIARIAQISKIA